MEGRIMKDSEALVIIGGGPAGIAAAIAAARAKVHCVLIDEAPHIGGQVYRQTSKSFQVDGTPALSAEHARWVKLNSEFNHLAEYIQVLSSTCVLGVWENGEILLASEGASGTIKAEQLIIATGAYERPVPFPGWTLPGVMTVGGVKSFIKTMHLKPGKRAIISGTGPLIISTANRLHETGVEVVAVLEAGNPPWASASFLKQWGEVPFAKDILDDLNDLKRNNIPLLFNHSILQAHGKHSVTRVTYAPIDTREWKPSKDRAKTVDADLVALGFGFVPNTELTELAGCRHEFYPGIGWFVVRDEQMQTTVPGIFAVGDAANISGAIIAEEEGCVAGIKAAQNLGAISLNEAQGRYEAPLKRLHSFQKFRKAINEATAIRNGLLELMNSETLVCRCEEVTLSEVKQALGEGAGDLQSLKLLTRVGMGPCQGRNCAPSMGMYLCDKLKIAPEQAGRINPRPPVKPVTLGALATMMNEEMKRRVSDSFDAINKGGHYDE
jgi:thioredoxin reductase/bacterioferritin-associated ferredoxin